MLCIKKFLTITLTASLLLISGMAVAHADLSDGLVAYYPFNGNANDESGNSHNGSITGELTFSEGVIGKSVVFNGNYLNYIRIPHDEDLNFKNSFSISIWIKTEIAGGNVLCKGRDIYSHYQIGSGGCSFNLNYTDSYGDAIGTYIPVENYTLKEWHHVVGIADIDNSIIKYFLDGQIINQEILSKQFNITTSYDLIIGRHDTYNNGNSSWAYPFIGQVDELRIYNRALSDSEIQELYKEGGGTSNTGNLSIRHTPMTGSPGTNFEIKGNNFTPNSTATLHFRKPDGTEFPTCKQPINAVGQFTSPYCQLPFDEDGEYRWWAVDGVKGWKSLELQCIIDSTKNIMTGIYKVTNSKIISNQFQLWLDISINNEAPGENFKNEYKIEIKDATMPSGVSIKTNEGNYYCEHKGNGSLNGGKSSRYGQFFQIVGKSGSSPVYFENGKVVIISKTTGNVVFEIKNLTKFSVYGTNFDITKDAWSFENSSWKYAAILTDIAKAAAVIQNYIPPLKLNAFWNSLGYIDWGKDIKKDSNLIDSFKSLGDISIRSSDGLCYGLANAAIANFNHNAGGAWGTGDISQWKTDIENHWSQNTDYAVAPFKPFPYYPQLFNLEWEFNTAKKIMYYFVGQASYEGGELWVGDDGYRGYTPINIADIPITILKKGSPISFGFALQGGGGTQDCCNAVDYL